MKHASWKARHETSARAGQGVTGGYLKITVALIPKRAGTRRKGWEKKVPCSDRFVISSLVLQTDP